MAVPFDKTQLAAAIAANMRLTATEVGDCLEVAAAAILKSLQEGNEVDLFGLGKLSIRDHQIEFQPSERLLAVAQDPNAVIRIENVKGMLPTELWNSSASVYKHHVNSCN
jgi:Bacterial DNA-binding protein